MDEYKYIICDIDNTISDCTHRVNYILKKPKDWKSFFLYQPLDKPIESVIKILEAFAWCNFEDALGITVGFVFCTGRSEEYRALTTKWLNENISTELNRWSDVSLLMRRKDDRRDDEIVKIELLKEANITPENTLFILEDRDRVVKAFRKNGYKVLQVAYGDF